MGEEDFELSLEIEGISDEQLDGIVGGLTDGDRQRLTRYIKNCKIKGYNLSDTLIELQGIYSKPWDERILNECVDFVVRNW